MTAFTTRIVLRAGLLLLPMVLVACATGDSHQCFSANLSRCTVVANASTGSTTGSTNNHTTASASAGILLPTGPTTVALHAGTKVSCGVGGAIPFYTTSIKSKNAVEASVSSTTLSLGSVAAGTSPAMVVDSLGQAVNIAPALSVAPQTMATGSCIATAPFIFSIGVTPYAVFTGDNFSAPVSSLLTLKTLLMLWHEPIDVDHERWNIAKTLCQNRREPNCRALLAQARTQRLKS